MRPGQVLVQLPYGAGGAAGDIEARVQATDGVTALLPIREAELFAGGNPVNHVGRVVRRPRADAPGVTASIRP